MADLFSRAIFLYGKHGRMAEDLCPDSDAPQDLAAIRRDKLLFDRIADVYMIAAMVGFVYQRRGERDGSTKTKTIPSETVIREQARLNMIYELIMVLDTNLDQDINKRLDRAFRKNGDSVKEGMDLFNSYVRGGIEILHEKLIAGCNTPDDLIENLVAFISDYDDTFLERDGGDGSLNFEELRL